MKGQLEPTQGEPHLLIHDGGEFAEHVFIMGPQFFLVFQLVFLDEALVHVEGLPTCVCELPFVTTKAHEQPATERGDSKAGC